MTAAELTCEVLDQRNISVRDQEYWSCWEVSVKEEMGETEGGPISAHMKAALQPVWVLKTT